MLFVQFLSQQPRLGVGFAWLGREICWSFHSVALASQQEEALKRNYEAIRGVVVR